MGRCVWTDMSHVQVLSLCDTGAKRASAFIHDTSASRGHRGWMENGDLALTDTGKRKKGAAKINLYLKHEVQVVLKPFE